MMFATSKKATHQRGKHTKPRTLTYRSQNHRVDAAFAPTCTNIKAGNSPLYEVKAAFLSRSEESFMEKPSGSWSTAKCVHVVSQ